MLFLYVSEIKPTSTRTYTLRIGKTKYRGLLGKKVMFDHPQRSRNDKTISIIHLVLPITFPTQNHILCKRFG